jgi:uncharacterized protein (TIGR00369 family)
MHDRKYLPNSQSCFVCGEENPAGLRARFYVEDEVVKSSLNIVDHHCGYPNTLHGGVAAAALDECMAWAATRALQRMCVTAELKVRYLRKVPSDLPLTMNATVVKVHRRVAQATGFITDAEGVEYVRAEGKFIPLSAEETLHIDDNLLYHGDEEHVFEALRREAMEKA